jgi:hypothetical protein
MLCKLLAWRIGLMAKNPRARLGTRRTGEPRSPTPVGGGVDR